MLSENEYLLAWHFLPKNEHDQSNRTLLVLAFYPFQNLSKTIWIIKTHTNLKELTIFDTCITKKSTKTSRQKQLAECTRYCLFGFIDVSDKVVWSVMCRWSPNICRFPFCALIAQTPFQYICMIMMKWHKIEQSVARDQFIECIILWAHNGNFRVIASDFRQLRLPHATQTSLHKFINYGLLFLVFLDWLPKHYLTLPIRLIKTTTFLVFTNTETFRFIIDTRGHEMEWEKQFSANCVTFSLTNLS